MKRGRTSSGSTTEDDYDYHPNMENKPKRKPTRVPKCFTKNALMARENRLKKKLYISSLEDEVSTLKEQNKKLSTIVENQSHLIQELRREIKYLKSVISNSDGIGKLMRNISVNTGMAVTTSFKDLDSKENVCKKEVARKTAHPWEESDQAYEQKFASLPTPESTDSYYSNPELDSLNEGLLDDINMPLDLTDNELLNMLDEQSLQSPLLPLDDHNYHYQPTTKKEDTQDDKDVGVCLHVSNNKVSLEFCQNCSENAQQAWTHT